jgi:hypothetical protein
MYVPYIIGFRVRVGYLCGLCGVHENGYEYMVKNIIYYMWCGYWSCKVTREVS